MSVPNQRIVKVHKDNTQKEPFLSLNIELMAAVYSDLGNAYTFYLYLCLCCNTDNYQFEFSPQHFKNKYNLPVSTTNDKFKTLVEKGYLQEGESAFAKRDKPFIKALKKFQSDNGSTTNAEIHEKEFNLLNT